MRKIKFRVWSKFNGGTMIFVNENGFYEKSFLHENGYWQSASLHSLLERKDVNIMQYVGLVDKNGREIYEGDILLCECRKKGDCFNFESPNPPEETIIYKKSIVEWWQSHFNLGYRLRDKKGKTLMIKPSSLSTMKVEVIGNIYENKELLTD